MKRMKGKILAILMSLAMVFTMMPLAAQKAYAIGDSPAVVKTGDLDNFAKDAPITTVRLDGSKFTKDNAILTYQMNNKYNSNKFEWGTTSAEARNCVVINDLTTENTSNDDDGVVLPGSFTLTFKDAAIMRDGTTKDFSATYTPEILMQQNTEPYTDSFTIVAFHSRKSGISVQPLSKLKIHFGLRVYITCQVVGDTTDNLNSETFLLVSDEINSVRPDGTGFSNIVWASDNNNYSEAIKFESGIDGESELYLPYESTLNTNPSEITGINGYDVKFIGSGTYSTGLNHIAAAASASGIRARMWSSAGTNDVPIDTYYLDVSNFTKEHTSSSGDGGKIELWTDGLTHNTDSEANNFRKLSGGTIATPYTYAVPYGKEVTYRMTPDEGYILDKLYVNKSETDPTNIVYKPDSTEVAYYEYHFDSDSVNSDQEISVTWKKYAATTNPIPEPNPTPTKVSGTPAAKMIAKGKTSLTISWNKIQGAEGYDIFFAQCNHNGKEIVCKNVKSIKGNNTFKWTKSGLKKGTAYKAYVKAYVMKNGKKTYVRTSPMMHAYTGNGNKTETNAKSVTIKNVKKGKLSLKKGKTFKVKAKVNKVNKKKKMMSKNHAAKLRYLSSDKKVATVSSSGKITAKGKGTCTIFVYAHNGVSKKVRVTVK